MRFSADSRLNILCDTVEAPSAGGSSRLGQNPRQNLDGRSPAAAESPVVDRDKPVSTGWDLEPDRGAVVMAAVVAMTISCLVGREVRGIQQFYVRLGAAEFDFNNSTCSQLAEIPGVELHRCLHSISC